MPTLNIKNPRVYELAKLLSERTGKSMTSVIETALELTEDRLDGAGIRQVVGLGKALLQRPVEPLPGVAEALQELAGSFGLMLITKGDLFDQETKLAKSGLGAFFSKVEIVSEKDEATYAAILQRHAIQPAAFTMVGNSVKSDILPVLALGARAIHIPYHTTWAHEVVRIGHRYDQAANPGGAGTALHLRRDYDRSGRPD